MKYYVIASMVFLFTLSVALISEIDVMNYNMPYDKAYLDGMESNSQSNVGFGSEGFDSSSQQDYSWYTQLTMAGSLLGKVLFYGTIGFPWLLERLGVPIGLATLFSLPVWFIFVVFLVQIIKGQSFEGGMG